MYGSLYHSDPPVGCVRVSMCVFMCGRVLAYAGGSDMCVCMWARASVGVRTMFASLREIMFIKESICMCSFRFYQKHLVCLIFHWNSLCLEVMPLAYSSSKSIWDVLWLHSDWEVCLHWSWCYFHSFCYIVLWKYVCQPIYCQKTIWEINNIWIYLNICPCFGRPGMWGSGVSPSLLW